VLNDVDVMVVAMLQSLASHAALALLYVLVQLSHAELWAYATSVALAAAGAIVGRLGTVDAVPGAATMSSMAPMMGNSVVAFTVIVPFTPVLPRWIEIARQA